MLILAIDTCLARCQVCVFDAARGVVMAELQQPMERGHAEALPPMVQDVMRRAGQAMKGLARIAVTTGPGTFTGVRIGLSFARALGLALHIPVLGLDTLHAFGLTHPQRLLGLSIGNSGLVYVLQHGVEKIAAVPRAELGDVPLLEGAPDVAALARWAASQPAPSSMPEPVYVREADAKPQIAVRAEQAATLAMLHRASFENAWSETEIAAMLAIPETHGLVAEAGGAAIGLVMLRIVAGEAEILTLASLPAWRRKGVGTMLVAAAIALCQRQEAQRLFLEVASGNEAARALYARQGFTETGRRKSYYANGDDAVLMTRNVP